MNYRSIRDLKISKYLGIAHKCCFRLNISKEYRYFNSHPSKHLVYKLTRRAPAEFPAFLRLVQQETCRVHGQRYSRLVMDDLKSGSALCSYGQWWFSHRVNFISRGPDHTSQVYETLKILDCFHCHTIITVITPKLYCFDPTVGFFEAQSEDLFFFVIRFFWNHFTIRPFFSLFSFCCVARITMEPMDPWPSSSQIDGGDKKKADNILSTAVGSRDTCIELEQEHMSETSTTIDRASLSKKNMSRQKWLTFLIGDVYAQDDPRDLSDKRKNIVIFILALGGVNGPLGSMIYMPGLLSVARDLHTTLSAVNGSVSAFVVFMGVAVSVSSCHCN